ncbi:hypothetical protein MTYP_02763 [Methylophilaceae bacterium]|nr:hypothetical protein MTYP_02763 [Methylophilaceae bacterium]
MNNIKQKYPTDNWGRSIIDTFFKDNGFQREESKQAAHESFLHLTAKENEPDEVWGQRCNALAIWALICIELDVQELEPLLGSIDLATKSLPKEMSPLWFENLVFDLVFHKFSASFDDFDITDTAQNLFRTIKLATKSFQSECGKDDRDFFRGGCLIGVKDIDVRQLSKTKDLLEKLGQSGINEAFFLLVALGMGWLEDQKKWIQKAAEGAWPTRQLAAYYYGLQQTDPNKGKHYLKKVVIPSEDDPDYGVLIELALKAKRELAIMAGRSGVTVVRGSQEDTFHLWSNRAEYVADQWETVERCVVSVQDIVSRAEWRQEKSNATVAIDSHQLSDPPIELSEHTRSLTLETGRLVESFLKWCLSEWHIKHAELHTAIQIDDWDIANLVPIIGKILGSNEDDNALDLDTLLHQADLKFDKNPRFFKSLNDKPHKVWDYGTNLNTLVVANAIAARCNPNHLFRHTSTDSLVEALGIFNAAYFVRNNNAHFANPRSQTSANEAIFWGNAVRTTVDQLMANQFPAPV